MAEVLVDAAGEDFSRFRSIFRILFRDRTAMFSLCVIIFIVAVAALASVLAPYDPVEQNIRLAFAAPSAKHWFGTDQYGRDLFSRVLFGTRPALVVGFFSVVLSIGVGLPLGAIAGLRGGKIDVAISVLVDIMMSFPSLLLALMVVTLAGSGLHTLVFAIGVAHVPLFIRLTRSCTLSVREYDFVAASRTFGAGDMWVLVQHIVPNVMGPVIVIGTLSIAGAIRDEAALSFLGLGIQPPQPSWGNLIRDGVSAILVAPWMALIPGTVLALSVLAINIVGDSIRNILDPRNIASSADKGNRR